MYFDNNQVTFITDSFFRLLLTLSFFKPFYIILFIYMNVIELLTLSSYDKCETNVGDFNSLDFA